MPALKFAVLAGDYIGPEVMSEALRVLEVVARQEKLELQPVPADVGGAAIDRHGSALPDATVQACAGADAILSSVPSVDPNGKNSRPPSSPSAPRSCRCAGISRSSPTSGPACSTPS